MYVSSTGGPKAAPHGPASARPGWPSFLGRLYWCFIHEIHGCIGCPGTDGKIHRVTNLVDVRRQVGDRDRVDLDKSAAVQNFDLEHVAQRDDFAGFLVGATTQSGSSAEEALKDEHRCLSVCDEFVNLFFDAGFDFGTLRV